ncbi:nicotinamide riboside transporter PnuC [Ideonella sp.]|jgi:nicotinamide mononucleotide transporter|uniref:nicotinamide riboside transporter PnuC n=1 Tax=Ideonella sp. TaxID=1929293 RepID=UPI0037BF46D9
MLDSLLQAAAPLLTPLFSLWGSAVTGAELVAFVLSLLMVVANMRVHPVAWPLAIISSALYGLLFAHFKLFGEAGLQVVFIVGAFWGWHQWLKGRHDDAKALKVSRLSPRQRLTALLATLAAWPVLAWLLNTHTSSDVAWLDALPTVGSLAGQLLLAQKRIENWPTWVAVNVVSVALFATKGLWLTVILYSLFTLMALQGWRAWKRLEGQSHG